MAKKGSTTTNTVETDPRAQRVQDALFGIAQGYNPQGYNGDLSAGYDEATLNRIKGLYGDAMGGFGQGFDFLQGQLGQTPDASPYQNMFENDVASAVQRQAQQGQQEAFNALDAQAAAQGGFRNNRLDLGYGTAAGSIQNTALDRLADLRYSGYQDSMNRARQGQQDQIGLAQGLVNLGLTGAQGAQGTLDYQRNIDQQGLDRQYNEYLRQQQFPFMRAHLYGSALQGPFGSSSETQQKKGWLDSIIGAGATVAGGLLGGPAGAAVGAGMTGYPASPSAVPVSQSAGPGMPWGGYMPNFGNLPWGGPNINFTYPGTP